MSGIKTFTAKVDGLHVRAEVLHVRVEGLHLWVEDFTLLVEGFTPWAEVLQVRAEAFTLRVKHPRSEDVSDSDQLHRLARCVTRRPGPLKIVAAQLTGYVDDFADEEESRDALCFHGP